MSRTSSALPTTLSSYDAKLRLARLDGGKFEIGNHKSRLAMFTPYGGDKQLVRVVWHPGDSEFQVSSNLGEFYIAGPMRGYPMFNFPAFLMAARVLQTRGFRTRSPAEKDIEAGFDPSRPIEEQGFDMGAAFRWDFVACTECTGIILLPGWENSTGAKAERVVATLSQREVYYLNERYELVEAPEMGYTLTWSAPPAAVLPAPPCAAPTVIEAMADDRSSGCGG